MGSLGGVVLCPPLCMTDLLPVLAPAIAVVEDVNLARRLDHDPRLADCSGRGAHFDGARLQLPENNIQTTSSAPMDSPMLRRTRGVRAEISPDRDVQTGSLNPP